MRMIYHCSNCHRDWSYPAIKQAGYACPVCGINVALKQGKTNGKDKKDRTGKGIVQN